MMPMPVLKNVLGKEKSLYLLQHATNPIHWQTWNKETLQLAKELEKPILVSIGYAACHWCHVMEKESFEDMEVASFMNDNFINIKIDREERPDLDQIYMDALQVLTGNGGWPLNIFLTPEGKPFFGGTYFPPTRTHHHASWIETLRFINDIWNNRRSEVEVQAEKLYEHLKSSGHFLFKNNIEMDSVESLFDKNYFSEVTTKILNKADFQNGGFGTAPKFPQLSSIQLLLNLYYHNGNEQMLHHSVFSLKQMLQGGIYDQLGGGLSRYSTDEHWHVPHFEKMLYDNALLIQVMCDAYQITNDPSIKDAIEDVINFCIRDLKSPKGGFYTSIDADSEGVEGKYYAWTKSEMNNILQENTDLICDWFGVSEKGNWEGVNILRTSSDIREYALSKGIKNDDLILRLKEARKLLLEYRNKRIRPLTDSKVLLNGNAMMITSLCKAAAALENEQFRIYAVELFEFINEKMSKEGMLLHSFSDQENPQIAFLDDYAYLIQASIHLQEITGMEKYLYHAKNLTEYVIANFQDENTGFFFYTNKLMNDAIIRKIDSYDAPTPSGNSVMVQNLRYLAVVFNNKQWSQLAENMLLKMSASIKQFPSSLSNWCCSALNFQFEQVEIIITGTETDDQRKKALSIFIPNKILLSAEKETDIILTKNKNYAQKALIYLCKNNHCFSPVVDFSDISDFHFGLTFSVVKKE